MNKVVLLLIRNKNHRENAYELWKLVLENKCICNEWTLVCKDYIIKI